MKPLPIAISNTIFEGSPIAFRHTTKNILFTKYLGRFPFEPGDYKKNIFTRAIAYLKEANEKIAGDPTLRYHLGMAYFKNGDKEDAAALVFIATAAVSRLRFPQNERG